MHAERGWSVYFVECRFLFWVLTVALSVVLAILLGLVATSCDIIGGCAESANVRFTVRLLKGGFVFFAASRCAFNVQQFHRC